MTELEKKVLAAINKRKLVPRPAYVFFAKPWVFWIFAVLAITLGAVSFAIFLFTLTGYFTDGIQGIDEIPLEEILFSIPFVWMFTMPFFIASTYFSLRHTRRGYRLRPVPVIALSMAVSLGLGGILHGVGAGHFAHEFLGTHVPYYHKLTYIPYSEWSQPDKKFLGGHADKLLDKNTLQLTDFRHQIWTIDISGATVTLDNAIEDEGDVAIRGVRTGITSFRAETIIEFD